MTTTLGVGALELGDGPLDNLKLINIESEIQFVGCFGGALDVHLWLPGVRLRAVAFPPDEELADAVVANSKSAGIHDEFHLVITPVIIIIVVELGPHCRGGVGLQELLRSSRGLTDSC
jgi:hypothetical protein